MAGGKHQGASREGVLPRVMSSESFALGQLAVRIDHPLEGIIECGLDMITRIARESVGMPTVVQNV